jgi:hypothetical protein
VTAVIAATSVNGIACPVRRATVRSEEMLEIVRDAGQDDLNA